MTLATHLDKLGAVNIMLAGASENGVNTLVDDGVNDTDIAQQILNDVIIKTFGKGWDFNTVTKTLSPDTALHIAVSEHYLRIDGSGVDYGRRLGVRSNKLYDLDNATDEFTKDVELCVTQNLEFEDSPIHVRYFIAHSAARIYQMKANGDTDADAILAKEESEAWEEIKKNDVKTRDHSWIHNSRDDQRVLAQRRTGSARRF